MSPRSVGIIMNGVTGRMGTNQHLPRSIVAIRQQGGVRLSTRDLVLPEPVLVGRNPAKLEVLAERAGNLAWTTNLSHCLADEANVVVLNPDIWRRPVHEILVEVQQRFLEYG